jgi:HPt (histidine-containing phosphotransfer) domain-containing protein
MKTYKINKLSEICMGDEAFITQMIQTFVEQIKKDLPLLQSAIVEENWEVVHKITHKIKPSIDMLDLESAKPLIKEMVEKTRNSSTINPEELTKTFYTLKEYLQETVEEMKTDYPQ